MKNGKVIFLSTKNPFLKKDWSGIPFFLYKALASVYEVEYVPIPGFNRIRRWGYYVSRIYFLMTKRKYLFDYGVVMAFLYGIWGSILVRKKTGIKFIFSPAGLTETAFLQTSIPVISYGDCSTLQLVDYYPALLSVSKISKWEVQFVESKALERAFVSAFSSTWASNFVNRKFRKTCCTIPFGSNLVKLQDQPTVKSLSGEYCNLLFVGVHFERKGGNVALKVHENLLLENFASRLTIVGTTIPSGTPYPDFVNVVPYVDKDTEEGEAILKKLFLQADFFILPTLADCTPIVIAEAYSYGLPVFATDTGGISSMVIDNVTGCLFDQGDVEGYVRRIQYLIKNPSLYSEMSDNCLKYHSATFNWDSWVLSLARATSSIC